MVGVVDTSEALRLARERGLDLVEVNPKSHPPVCKIMDFGKYKYEEKKKQAEARKKQTTIGLKEIKIRPKTDDHDLDFKIKHVIRFLEDGNKVKVTCRFRGREITHPEAAQRQIDFIADSVKEHGAIEATARIEGRNMTLILAPVSKGRVHQLRATVPEAPSDKPVAEEAPLPETDADETLTAP
jgi:translation initiation factor IF-3